MGTVAWIVLIILVMISGAAGGKSGLVLGVAGLLDLVFSAVGFLLAMRCYKKRSSTSKQPTFVINCTVSTRRLIIKPMQVTNKKLRK